MTVLLNVLAPAKGLLNVLATAKVLLNVLATAKVLLNILATAKVLLNAWETGRRACFLLRQPRHLGVIVNGASIRRPS